MSILKKLYLGTRTDVLQDIFSLYKKKGALVVNYLYFANIMHQRLLEKSTNKTHEKYKNALKNSDFLLTDGIALQRFYRFGIGRKKKITPFNLNGTDLFPEIMKQLKKLQKLGKKIHIARYGVYDPQIGRTKKEAFGAVSFMKEKRGLKVNFLCQSLYKEKGKDFDRCGYKQSFCEEDYDIRIFCTFLGTPFQEIRIEKHRIFFKKNNIMVLNQGGTIDFLSGFETRAPLWIVKSRVLETLWRICNNPKKNGKKLLWMFGIIRYWVTFVFQKIVNYYRA